MEPALTSLLAASIALIGTHFAMSHPLRAPMVSKFGENGFLGIYSLVSLVFFVWMVWAFWNSEPGGPMLWDGSGDVIWAITSVLTLVALVLFVGSYVDNPALPQIEKSKIAVKEASGAFLVTRHPMMWGFGIWAMSHILVSPSARTLIFAGSILLLALLGAHFQDRKKQALLGDAWKHWEAQTTYWPRLGKLFSIGWIIWVIALALWVAFSWLHIWLGGIPAGIWRWFG